MKHLAALMRLNVVEKAAVLCATAWLLAAFGVAHAGPLNLTPDEVWHPLPIVSAQSFKRERVYRGDYMVTCRTDGACDAITFTDVPTANGQNFSSSLTFKRAAGPGTAWILTFAGAFDGPVSGTPIEVRIGRQNWFLAHNQGYSDRIGDLVGHNYFLHPVNEQIVPAMVRGNAIEITQTVNSGGQQTVRYSLNGLTAAMRWIDQRQRRSGDPMLIGVPFSLEEAIPQ